MASKFYDKDTPAWSRNVDLAVFAVVCLVFGTAFMRVWASSRTVGAGPTCLSHVKQIGMSMEIYANDYDDHLPGSTRWIDQTHLYSKDKSIWTCPNLEEGQYGYAMLDPLSQKSSHTIANPGNTQLLFETNDLVRNAHARVANVLNPSRHYNKNSVLYADFHAKYSVLP